MYKLLTVSGPDAMAFLQGQLTQDVSRIAPGGSLPAAWCNPRGRVIATLRVFACEEGYRLFLPASVAEAVNRKLHLYKLRSQIDIQGDNDQWSCLAITWAEHPVGGDIPQDLLHVTHGASTELTEVFGPTKRVVELGRQMPGTLDLPAWSRALIRLGIVQIGADSSEKFTPHMLNLDKTGAVSFTKGCYTGQEVVARTEHLGRSRRRLMHYRYQAGDITAGEKLSHRDNVAGSVVNASSGELLAVTPVDIHDQQLTVNGVVVSPGNLPYSIA